MTTQREIMIWDPLVRFFHWTLVACFALAFVTEDDFLGLHVWAGYVIGILLLVRVAWGFVGTRHARFSDFVFSPRRVKAYLRELFQGRARRWLGHNPAGGMMIVAMMITLGLTVITGLMVYAVGDDAGPLRDYITSRSELFEDVLEGTHEFLANLMVLMVVVHVAGVLVESLLHRDNLIGAMISGRKKVIDEHE